SNTPPIPSAMSSSTNRIRFVMRSGDRRRVNAPRPRTATDTHSARPGHPSLDPDCLGRLCQGRSLPGLSFTYTKGFANSTGLRRRGRCDRPDALVDVVSRGCCRRRSPANRVMAQAIHNGRRIQTIIRRLKQAHPDAKLALDFTSPFELLIALILAAQCTDE